MRVFIILWVQRTPCYKIIKIQVKGTIANHSSICKFNPTTIGISSILDYAIYHEIDKKYGIDGLKAFVYRVGDCYLKDSNKTPLGALTDYMAEHWEELKEESRYDILDKFYMQLD